MKTYIYSLPKRHQALFGLCFLFVALSPFLLMFVFQASAQEALPPAPSQVGLVAAYSFDEGMGNMVTDASGNGNDGTISGATWTTGHFGGALSFDGLSNLVTVNDSNSLDLTSGMTLEAWIFPTSAPAFWTTVIFKEQPEVNNQVYG